MLFSSVFIWDKRDAKAVFNGRKSGYGHVRISRSWALRRSPAPFDRIELQPRFSTAGLHRWPARLSDRLVGRREEKRRRWGGPVRRGRTCSPLTPSGGRFLTCGVDDASTGFFTVQGSDRPSAIVPGDAARRRDALLRPDVPRTGRRTTTNSTISSLLHNTPVRTLAASTLAAVWCDTTCCFLDAPYPYGR